MSRCRKRGYCKTMWSRSRLVLEPGERIKGRWHGREYHVERLLGAGSNGQVWLVAKEGKRYALKLGYDALDLQSEINGLNDLQKEAVQAESCLIDTDDWEYKGDTISFYVVRYIPGVHPAKFLRDNGIDWFPVIGYRILMKLAELHRYGYVFGDLKSANILVSGYGTTELIDFGGLTKVGKAVRQYTERYDRGFWRGGSRTADAAYDLFAFAILCLELADEGTGQLAALEEQPERSVEQLCRLAERLPASRKVAPVIRNCLSGQLTSASEAAQAWKRCVYSSERKPRMQQQRRTSSALTASLAIAFALSATIFGVLVYWTVVPGAFQ